MARVEREINLIIFFVISFWLSLLQSDFIVGQCKEGVYNIVIRHGEWFDKKYKNEKHSSRKARKSSTNFPPMKRQLGYAFCNQGSIWLLFFLFLFALIFSIVVYFISATFNFLAVAMFNIFLIEVSAID